MNGDEARKLEARRSELRGNTVVELDDPQCVWVVERGVVGLFGVTLREGQQVGQRRFLLSRHTGEALFALPRAVADGRHVVAVAIETTTLSRFGGPDLASRVHASGLDPAAAIGSWIEAWEGVVGPIASPDRVALPGATATDAVVDDRVETALGEFHGMLGRRLSETHGADERREGERMRERELQADRSTREALARLTSVLDPSPDPLLEGSDLFVAAAAVAQASGVRLTPPALWESHSARTDAVEMIARASHIRCRAVQLSDDWWTRENGPLLAFRTEGHLPVALLERPGGGAYELFDPTDRSRLQVDATIAAELEPEARVFYRPLPADAASGLALIRFALRGRARDMLAILLTATAATLLGMFTPQATALLVDHAIPDSNKTLLLQIGMGLFAAAFGAAIFRFAQGIAMMRVETAADAATQAGVWDHLLNLQLSFFRRFSTGDLQSRVTAVSQIRAYLSGTTLRTLFSSVILLLNLVLLIYYSRTLAVVALVVAVLSATVTIVSGTMILKCFRAILELKGKFFGLMVQLIGGVSKLRVAAAEERGFARWAAGYSELLRLELRQRKIQDNVQVINVAISTLSTIVLFGVAATSIRTEGSALTTGVFLAFNVAFGTFIGAIVGLSNTVTDVMAIAILRERARPILEAAPEVNENKTDPGRLDGRIELSHVVFQYTDEGPIVLDDVSIRAEAGQFVALVGPSGSGKSTVLRLLLGLETPASGTIYYDGQDLSGLDVFAVRRQMGVVLQNGRINAGSLIDNIACGTQISLEDGWQAARATGFAGDIEAMPMGMHTVISEGGTNLSGGQRQRLLLTRALVHHPRMLVLDEATSALDNETQAVVSESLERLDVTRIVIAHRLSTIRHADRIYVVEAGRVVQQGTFDELSAQEGLFARLMARQRL